MQTASDTIIRVGLVDDHVILMRPFFDVLNNAKGIRAMFLVHSGEALFQLLETIPEYPDIILMDIDMPGMGGIEATRQVIKLYPQIKIVAFTAKDNKYSIQQMKDAGACAYFRKDIEFTMLEQALSQIYKKGQYDKDLSYLHERSVDQETLDEAKAKFSEKELQFLDYMSRGHKYEEIGKVMHMSRSQVEKHRIRLGIKLHTQKQAFMVRKAIELGLLPLRHQSKSNNI